MKYSNLLTCLLLCGITDPAGAVAKISEAVPPAVPILAKTFDLADVQLAPSPFLDARERDRAYLLSLDADRLLHTFRLNVGLPSTAQPYGGWEAPGVELRGHSLGHYLSACALMVRSTGDAELKQRLSYLVTELARCQAASPKAGFQAGYLSAFPESFIDRVETRHDVWAPWYTLHKILAGLIDTYELTENPEALAVARNMAGWVRLRVDHLTPEQMQASLETEFGGMNDALANLYAITGDKEHLRLARAFDHAAIFNPLADGKDPLDGLHANTQIPKVIGAAREFELTGDERYRKIAETFWTDVVLHRSYVIGGDSDREHFFPVNEFRQHLSPETTETCNTYNMLKLTRHLFTWKPDARAIDFYERGLYNHILASQDPAQGMFVYLMSLEPGHYKTYSTPENSFWCCVGTGMENHAKYGDTIYAHDDQGIFVNLFIPSQVSWAERKLTLKQETAFPNADTTRLTVSCSQPTELTLKIRHPGWSAGNLKISVNGKVESVSSEPGTYVELRRTWQEGDQVDVQFAMALHSETLPGTDDLVALLYGPIVLAGKLGIDGMPHPYARDQLDQARFPHPDVPAFVTANSDWLQRIRMISRSPLLFRTEGLAQPMEVLLEPFYQVHHERNAVYWRKFSPEKWNEYMSQVDATEAEWKRVPAAALDYVLAGDGMSEAAHSFQGGKTDQGTVSARTWREAQKGGSFSYRLKTNGSENLTLVCAYASRDMARSFKVLIDDVPVASPALDGTAPGEIRLEKYPVPASATKGKDAVTVKFQAKDDWTGVTANVFGCALVPAP